MPLSGVSRTFFLGKWVLKSERREVDIPDIGASALWWEGLVADILALGKSTVAEM